MNIDDYYGSDFLGAADIKETPTWVIVDSQVGQSEKYNKGKERIILTLEANEERKDWTLNRTNANKIAELLGSKHTEDWVGAKLTLYTVMVSVNGEEKEGIRVKTAEKKA